VLKKKIVILGGGESGIGAAVLASKKGFNVFVSDSGPIKEKYRSVLLHHEISFEEGKHTEKEILKADEVIKSPGIPDNAAIIIRIKKEKIPVISEIEFAGRFTGAKKICITGSNGKTTTTLLTHHMLKKAGLNAGLAGNVGQSFALQVAENDFDYYVLEISSFQLDGMFDFKADIAVITNITPDHLDRYNYSFQDYIDSKFRIIRNQTQNDALIYCADDPVTVNELSRKDINATKYPFSIKQKISGQGAYSDKKNMYINIKSNTLKMTLDNLALQGKHNIYNSMAAGITGRILDIRNDKVKESMSDFKNVEHRLEYVARIHGVEFINDSKATNVNSTWYALESMNNPVIWIAGGIDKGNDYKLLKRLVSTKVKAIICLGKDNSKIKKAFHRTVNTIVETTSMDNAVKWASSIGKKDDIVLLSPSCASFDLFENFEERGKQFKAAVGKL
jgi:UDP-N-acetylmuramoylalanine--D-glutamate ligase